MQLNPILRSINSVNVSICLFPDSIVRDTNCIEMHAQKKKLVFLYKEPKGEAILVGITRVAASVINCILGVNSSCLR